MALGLVWYMIFNKKNLGSVGMNPTNPLSSEEKKIRINRRYHCSSHCDCTISYIFHKHFIIQSY